jgi:hypothetical protein
MVSPAFAGGHWGYCEMRDGQTFAHYYSDVAVINADKKDVESEFKEFIRDNFAKESDPQLGKALCLIDFDTRAEAEAERNKRISPWRDKNFASVVEVTFVYVAH